MANYLQLPYTTVFQLAFRHGLGKKSVRTGFLVFLLSLVPAQIVINLTDRTGEVLSLLGPKVIVNLTSSLCIAKIVLQIALNSVCRKSRLNPAAEGRRPVERRTTRQPPTVG